MLSSLLPLIERVIAGEAGQAMAGTAASLGMESGGIQRLVDSLRQGSVRPFGTQAELGSGYQQIAELKKQTEDLERSRREQRRYGAERLREFEDKQSVWYDPQKGLNERANQEREEQQHQAEVQRLQREREQIQSRAAATLNPSASRSLAMRGAIGRAAASYYIGQGAVAYGQQAASAAMRPVEEGLSFIGGPGANVINQAGKQVGSSAGNIASGAVTGASIGSMAGPWGTVGGAVVGGVVSSAGEIAKIPNRIKDWSEALLESQKTISRFSGQMSAAFAQAEVRGIRRDIVSANATAGSTSDLSNSMQDLYDTLRPLKDSLTNVVATDLAALARAMNSAVPLLEAVVTTLAEIAAFIPGIGPLAAEAAKVGRNAMAERAKNEHDSSVALSELKDAIKGFRERHNIPPRVPPR